MQKECECCGTIYDHEGWESLPLIGIQKIPGEYAIELRNCGCRSTLGIETDEFCWPADDGIMQRGAA